jgi:hypothetical protein
LNPGRRGGKPATNRLSYGAAIIPVRCASTANIVCKDVDVFGAGNVHTNQFLKYAITIIIIISGVQNS